MVAVKQAYDSGTSLPALRAGRMLQNLSFKEASSRLKG